LRRDELRPYRLGEGEQQDDLDHWRPDEMHLMAADSCVILSSELQRAVAKDLTGSQGRL
jgi:hypothetical protein